MPSGIATENTTRAFFEEVSTKTLLISLYDFENTERLFPSEATLLKFCLLTLGIASESASFISCASKFEDLTDARRKFILKPHDITLLNPNTKTASLFRSNLDAELAKKIYGRLPVLIKRAAGTEGNPWGIRFMAMFHMSNDSGLFRTHAQLSAAAAHRDAQNWVEPSGAVWVPLYEAKMMHLYDHRFGSYPPGHVEDTRALPRLTIEQYNDQTFEVNPRYYVSYNDIKSKLAGYWNKKVVLMLSRYEQSYKCKKTHFWVFAICRCWKHPGCHYIGES